MMMHGPANVKINTVVLDYILSLHLTFKNRASYIYDGRTATLKMLHFVYFFHQI